MTLCYRRGTITSVEDDPMPQLAFAGNGEHQGRLSAEDEKVMKRYQTELTIFRDSSEIDNVLAWLRHTFSAS